MLTSQVQNRKKAEMKKNKNGSFDLDSFEDIETVRSSQKSACSNI